MLNANLDYADLSAPASMAGGSVHLGSSTIVPLRHRMLRTVVTESDGFLAVATFERFAGDPCGPDHRRAASDEALLTEARACRGHALDWSCLTVDRNQRTLRYESSFLPSAPIYAFAGTARATLDWDCSRLLAGLEVQIDWEAAMAHFGGTAGYSPRTMVRDLRRSTAGATLVLRPGAIEVRLPEPSRLPGPRRLADGVEPRELLFNSVKALIAARPVDRERTAVDISGGMDSALVSIAAAEALGAGLMSTGAQFRGAMGKAQRGRRRLLCDHGGFDDIDLPADRFAPFSIGSPRRIRFGAWPQDDTYPEILETLLSVLERAGIDTLISGFGGDELYAAYEGEGVGGSLPDEDDAAPYLTDRGRALAAEAVEAYPTGPLQETSWQAAAGRSQRLLRHGIWPIYPYHSPELARFVAALPWEWRRDRRLLRATLTEKLKNPVFEEDYVKESFRGVAAKGVTDERDYLLEVIGRSKLLRPDLVERDDVLADLAGDPAALPAARFNALFALLTACCFFDEGAAAELPVQASAA